MTGYAWKQYRHEAKRFTSDSLEGLVAVAREAGYWWLVTKDGKTLNLLSYRVTA